MNKNCISPFFGDLESIQVKRNFTTDLLSSYKNKSKNRTSQNQSPECPTSRDDPPKCVLCSDNQPANYRDCTIHKGL